MPSFARSFAVDVLAAWDAKSPGNAVRALFDRWCLPGESCSDKAALRIGLRDGYLNFYVRGQSVAKLSCGRDGPSLSVHDAYVLGRRKGEANTTPQPQAYRDYDGAALASSETAALIAGWISTAETYASAEKCFVDALIAANPGVIDLEMALPANDVLHGDRVAPRMDLVVAQKEEGGALSICFWEAKCANNPELRASGESVPKVVGQVQKYVHWMEQVGRVKEIQRAYRRAATDLLALHALFRGGDPVPVCVSIWQALAEQEAPSVVIQPGIVISSDWPDGYVPRVAHGRMAQCAASFARNGHRDKLQEAGIRVHEVGGDHDGPELPALVSAGQSK